MNRAFEKELSRALATELDTAASETLLRRCRAEHVGKQRSDWRDLLHCQFKLLGWKVWALEATAALALYSVGRELALWEKAWTLRNALFGPVSYTHLDVYKRQGLEDVYLNVFGEGDGK